MLIFMPHGFWGDLGETVITLVWIVGLTNAFNYLDGMDGLAAPVDGSHQPFVLCGYFALHRPDTDWFFRLDLMRGVFGVFAA